jgi:hypothetical protein
MSNLIKGVIVLGFLALYGFGMRGFLDAGISWTGAPILFPVIFAAACYAIGVSVDRRAARQKRLMQPRAPKDWRVPGSHLIPPPPSAEARQQEGSRSHLVQDRLR